MWHHIVEPLPKLVIREEMHEITPQGKTKAMRTEKASLMKDSGLFLQLLCKKNEEITRRYKHSKLNEKDPVVDIRDASEILDRKGEFLDWTFMN
ncbi:hypothetical protein ACH5RR_030330 [Cinchona calisaya]|uniref:Uncharacterized protein n=1 Tax=Cinchona calisaya TaxID=153742 RepID=A0ABD2YUA2_9GENT